MQQILEEIGMHEIYNCMYVMERLKYPSYIRIHIAQGQPARHTV